MFAVQTYLYYNELGRNMNNRPIDHIGPMTSRYNNKQGIAKLSCFKRNFKDMWKL